MSGKENLYFNKTYSNSMGYYCSACKETITARAFNYSNTTFGKPLCMNHQKMARDDKRRTPKITLQARRLSEALTRRGIKNKVEHYDGYKHVDISITWARLNIEIDGKRHQTDARQLSSDLKRDSYSHEHGFATKRFTNEEIDQDLEGIADTLAEVAKERRREKIV